MNQPLHTAYVGMGANLGEPLKQLAQAVEYMRPHTAQLRASPIYRTVPVGIREQPEFFNMVVELKTALSPQDLHAALKAIEADMGRVPAVKNGPRHIDLDLLFYDDLVLETPRLRLPHASAHTRDFVLKPLLDLGVDPLHPALQRRCSELLQVLTERTVIEKI